MSLATRRSTAALSLSGCSASSLCCGPQRRNSFEHFGDEKLRLKLRHVLGYDVSISAQTKRCPEVARCLLLDHDLAQHSLLQGIAPVPRFSKLVGHAARQQERREVETLRLSMAAEIRRLVDIMLQTHEVFDRVSGTDQSLLADDVVKELSRGTPVVYPGTPDRVGLLGRFAPDVVTFYANLDELEYAGWMTARDPVEPVPPDALREPMRIIEGVKTYCRCCPNCRETKPTPTPNVKRRLKRWAEPGGAPYGHRLCEGSSTLSARVSALMATVAAASGGLFADQWKLPGQCLPILFRCCRPVRLGLRRGVAWLRFLRPSSNSSASSVHALCGAFKRVGGTGLRYGVLSMGARPDAPPCAFSPSLEVTGALIFLNRR